MGDKDTATEEMLLTQQESLRSYRQENKMQKAKPKQNHPQNKIQKIQQTKTSGRNKPFFKSVL